MTKKRHFTKVSQTLATHILIFFFAKIGLQAKDRCHDKNEIIETLENTMEKHGTYFKVLK